jgi:hypothetical protein
MGYGMNYIEKALLGVALLLCGPVMAANGNVTVFPPIGCSAATPYFSWDGQQSQTSCQDGQQVLRNAIPGCLDGQAVEKENGVFICRDIPALIEPPTCTTNQFLTYDGDVYKCKEVAALILPNCQSNQALTVRANQLTCIDLPSTTTTTVSIPACGSDQVLTGNGTSMHCVDLPSTTTTTVSIPSCSANQVLTGNNSQMRCVDLPELPPVPTPEPKLTTLTLTCASQNGDTPDANAVIGYYKTSLGRCADIGGFTYWLTELTQGHLTLSQIAAHIAASSEARDYAANGVNSAQIRALCDAYLGYTYRQFTEFCYPQ